MQIGHSPNFNLDPVSKKIEVLGTMYSNDYQLNRTIGVDSSFSDDDFIRVMSRSPSRSPRFSPQPRTLDRHIDVVLDSLERSSDPLPRSPRPLSGRTSPLPDYTAEISQDEIADEKSPAVEPEIQEDVTPVLQRSPSDPKINTSSLLSRMPPEIQERIARIRQERIEHDELVEFTKKKAQELQHQEQVMNDTVAQIQAENAFMKEQVATLTRLVAQQEATINRLNQREQNLSTEYQRSLADINARQILNEDLVLGLSKKTWVAIAVAGVALIGGIVIIIYKIRK